LIASLIISFNSLKLSVVALFVNLHQAADANFKASKGIILFHSGVVFVFAQIGVVALA
jgi:hypothetical protein